MQSKLFLPGDTKPIMESTTLFYAGRVYDFLTDSDETTVFDSANNVIKLLDPKRKITTEITTVEIVKTMNLLHVEAREKIVDPKFEESQNPITGEVLLTTVYLSYRLKTFIPPDPGDAQQYVAFASWSLQLGAMLRLQKDSDPIETLPFLLQMRVNEVLKQRQELPLEVVRTLKPQKKRKKPVVTRIEHSIQSQLSQEDYGRINEADDQLHTFSSVNFDEYRKAGQQE
jgi:hypothetical protein